MPVDRDPENSELHQRVEDRSLAGYVRQSMLGLIVPQVVSGVEMELA